MPQIRILNEKVRLERTSVRDQGRTREKCEDEVFSSESGAPMGEPIQTFTFNIVIIRSLNR